MKVHEFLSKRLLSSYGVHVPHSILVKKEKDAFREIPLPYPRVLKSQVLVGSRMKKGGVLFANSYTEYCRSLSELLEKKIDGESPYGVLVEEKIEVKEENYISLLLDRNIKGLLLMYSEEGGIDVESSNRIIRGNFENVVKLLEPQMMTLASRLRDLAFEKDLTLVEINPIARELNGELVALDAVFHLDDAAIYRQKWFEEFVPTRSYPFQYVELEGNMGIIGCGAGIVMATIDHLKEMGAEPADFLDLGGGADERVASEALRFLQSKGLKKILINIFGGITKCDEIAKSIVEFKNAFPDCILYVRLTGTNEEVAKDILDNAGVNFYDDMYSMIEEAVRGKIS